MKFKILLFLIAFNFSFITASNQLLKRNLAYDNKQFLLIGFGNYSDTDRSFNMYILFINEQEKEIHPNIYFNISLKYQNQSRRDNVPVNCFNYTNIGDQSSTYWCSFNDGEGNNITSISLNNYLFKVTNSSGIIYLTFNENDIIFSTLANSTIKNIEKQTDVLYFNIFYLSEEPIIKKNGVELNGNINWKDDVSKNFTFDLSLPEKVKCNYYYNYSRNNYDKIIFSPQNDVSVNLNAIMTNTSYQYYDDHYILIYTKNYDDLILYSNDKYSYIELLGFRNYTKQTGNVDATAIAHLKGTLYSFSSLKDYMKFTFSTNNGTNITARGFKNNLLENNIMTYYVIFEGTSKLNDEPNIFYKDFIFSDNYNNFTNGVEQIDVYPEDMHIRNGFKMAKEIKFPSKPKEVSNGLYFDFTDPSEFEGYTFEKRADAYMSYIPMNENFREIIKCAFVNNTDSYDLICNPQKSFITYMNTLRMSVEGIRKSRRLRFLQTKENITFSSPMNSTELIDYTYDPEFNNFAKKVSKNKGLSAGAIVAIVLSSIAVVAAVGIAIFFLNKKEPKPIKNLNNNSYLQNSTSNINK